MMDSVLSVTRSGGPICDNSIRRQCNAVYERFEPEYVTEAKGFTPRACHIVRFSVAVINMQRYNLVL